jgi:hypothetical protein
MDVDQVRILHRQRCPAMTGSLARILQVVTDALPAVT